MARIFIPTIAFDENDLKKSVNFLGSFDARTVGVGLMLVAKDGMDNFVGDGMRAQYENLSKLDHYERFSFIVMAPNLPLGDIDFYHEPEKTLVNLKLVVDFTAGLPVNKNLKIVTFHLNSLLQPQEWAEAGKNISEKFDRFQTVFLDKILPSLRNLSAYAKNKGVGLRVETTPVPEFGDIAENTELSRLGNPYPIYSGRGADEIRDAGLGVALDLCHTFTLFKAAKFFKERGGDFFEVYKGIFPADISLLESGGLSNEINLLKDGDVVHLNDGLGLYDPEKNIFYKEGLALGAGEIEELPFIIRVLKDRDLNMVFEINESDFINRPNLRRSIEYFKSIT